MPPDSCAILHAAWPVLERPWPLRQAVLCCLLVAVCCPTLPSDLVLDADPEHATPGECCVMPKQPRSPAVMCFQPAACLSCCLTLPSAHCTRPFQQWAVPIIQVCSGLRAAPHAGLGSLATKIPLAVLAGILVNSGIDIIDKDYLKRARQLPWDTLLVLVGHDAGLHVFQSLLKDVRQLP